MRARFGFRVLGLSCFQVLVLGLGCGLQYVFFRRATVHCQSSPVVAPGLASTLSRQLRTRSTGHTWSQQMEPSTGSISEDVSRLGFFKSCHRAYPLLTLFSSRSLAEVPSDWSSENTTDLSLASDDTYLRNSRLLEGCGSSAWHKFRGCVCPADCCAR